MKNCDVKGHTLDRHLVSLGACDQNGFFGQPLAAHIGDGYGRSAQRGLDPDLKGLVGKPWRAPTLKREGAPFKPSAATTGVPVGASISWVESGAMRTGQVFSGHWKPRCVWVAPSDGGSAVAIDTKTGDVLR